MTTAPPTPEPLDLTGFRPATLRDQPQPMLQWVDVAALVVDRRYRRSITAKGRGAIQRMADGWDWTKCGAIMCAPATGGLIAIVDGQHRAHAAALAGIDQLPAVIVPMTPQQQAAGFAAINRDRVKIDNNALFRAELAAGTEWAVQADAAVRAAGCRMGTSHPNYFGRKPGYIYSPVLIRKMIEAGEGEAITAGLRAIRESAAGEHVESWAGPVLKIWLGALAANQRWLRLPDLPAVFDSFDFETELANARAWARQQGGSPTAFAQDRIKAVLRGWTQEDAA